MPKRKKDTFFSAVYQICVLLDIARLAQVPITEARGLRNEACRALSDAGERLKAATKEPFRSFDELEGVQDGIEPR